MLRNYSLLRLILWKLFFLTLYSDLQAQETNSRASGRVITDSKEAAAGFTVTVVHEPTQDKYFSITRNDGHFDLLNLKPGGPYSIIISSAGYETLKQTNLFISLKSENFSQNNTEITEFSIKRKIVSLNEVIINSNISNIKAGIETIIINSVLSSMPNINRSFQDLIRLVPQAKVNGEGVMSLAGQNNRFNAFFIDGASNTDIRGLAANGMNGGQTGSPPISIEAIEEINVLQAPYNVQYGNFTGGSINTITRSGSNENKSSVWYYFRNEALAGRSPQSIEKPDEPGKFYRPRLTKFFNQIFGARNSGALVKNKLFYFLLIERQSESRPQPFSIKDYRGSINQQQLNALSDFVKNMYLYQTGSFLETKDDLSATRLNIKLDWNMSLKNKFMFSYRHNNAERITAPRPSGPRALYAHHSGIMIPTTTNTASFEWKYFIMNDMTNRLLATFTSQEDYRKWIGQPFPSVTISDGSETTVNFGSETATGINDFRAIDLGLLDVFTLVNKKHLYTIGVDLNLTAIKQRAVPAFFGAYQFRTLNDFLNMTSPLRLQRTFYLPENNSPQFNTARSSFFVNDEIRFQKNLKIGYGIRFDINSILSRPAKDEFFNDTAINIISVYYDIKGAKSGQVMNTHLALSPRFSVDYKILKPNITLKAGAGIFVGHIINAWIFDVFNGNTGSIDITPKQFFPDPYNQPTPASLNIDPSDLKGSLIVIAKHFKYPSVFRSSFIAEKKLSNNWLFSIEWMFTKNIHEMSFRNVNILPPVNKSQGPGARNIYSFNQSANNPAANKIPLKINGSNPYAQIMLVANNPDKTGYSYSASFVIHKHINNFSFNSSYSYGRSNLLFEVTGPQTPVFSQWRNMETVNGRNLVNRSTSDNDLRHRITAWISKRISYSKRKMATTFSIFYNGQSGSPYSYVYTNSMINDNVRRNENFDLIYIPTKNDLTAMNFVPITGQISYSAEQQKAALNAFIENDKYLKKHRGEFAKRNAARLPFTHIIDLRLQQDFEIKTKKKLINVNISYDVFNFTNMLNKNWGQIYFLLNDSYPLITFQGFIPGSTLTPQYQFTPFNGKPYSLQTSTIPGNSIRWISQLGIKLSMN